MWQKKSSPTIFTQQYFFQLIDYPFISLLVFINLTLLCVYIEKISVYISRKLYINNHIIYKYAYICKICQQDSVDLRKSLNDFSKSVLLDWGPLNDVQDPKALSLISSTSSVSRMFHSFLKRKIGKLQQKIFFFQIQITC